MEGGQRKSDVLSVAAYIMLPEKLPYCVKGQCQESTFLTERQCESNKEFFLLYYARRISLQ